MFGRRRPPPAPTAERPELIAPADEPLEVVLRQPGGHREIRLGVVASMRDLEVLGSAGRYYADSYENAERPDLQVQVRRDRARRVGDAVWEATIARCGIEDPGPAGRSAGPDQP
jgi:hypothetical protein